MKSTTEVNPRIAPPGWPEIVVGIAVLALVGFGLPILVSGQVDLTSPLGGALLACLSGVAGLAGFAAAAALRRRTWGSFGLRRASAGWLWLGVAGGVVALLAKGILTPLFLMLTDAPTDTQAGYAAGASSGPWLLVLTAIGLIVLTPIGEELLFRGVVTTGLLRYGPIIATVGSAVIFALLHGINVVLPAALVVGIITAELRRRSDSVWPGVVVHAFNNSITVIAYALIPGVVS
ncbi:CPBP family intramembrane glutamic endopeptidase [Promicromonospora iranensis]|uniref:Membrane protease YdiL (CAAX protease family) n=1 Tax=Promicromonospora iranensis TaxID=1105144 RepID=A0ABU2CU82_9MICO|nr:type II CAAX endopeptidase family protein [Promicromonospora iranensis]MDR7384707.1 membrane protease YdiL (CAAX protease family) [Promicromonospora iranensis]